MTRHALIAAFVLGILTTGTASFAATDATVTSGKGEPASIEKRSKPRVPGGSGCDTPADIAQHPECR